MSTWTMAPVVPAPPKQIRFVNNEGRPPAKRRRVDAACQTCRKRKIRCDGTRPQCSTCKENGHQCLGYNDSAAPPASRSAAKSSGNNEAATKKEEEDVPEIKKEKERSPKIRRKEKEQRDASPVEKAQAYEDDLLIDGSYNDDGANLQLQSRRVPYFRYFGPTAIVPGFKQMVVSIREHRRSTGAGSVPSGSPLSNGYSDGSNSKYSGRRPSIAMLEPRAAAELPSYDPTDPMPVSRLIKHLVETFFVHLGCNFPFLRKEKVTRMVEEKRLEPILVDAICSLAARFSDHQLLTMSHGVKHPRSEYGQVFAQRAKALVIETFPCPTVAAVQACLLLAYEGFGANQDSALWMFTGCAIRMALDLGLDKEDGVRIQGDQGSNFPPSYEDSSDQNADTSVDENEQKASEQERIDTLWAIFMLDRVISSGTGRPVTLRDEDFELSLPVVKNNRETGLPAPFPALIQIIHLYGRVSDLLNNIKSVKDLTQEKMQGLASMEQDLTNLYGKLDQRLTFSAANFQLYMKAGESTNFVLLHFWFHTLIMLVHQPMLMHSFAGPIQQLLPNSRELSMSSAKTIADILSFAELIDPKSFIGNPFTSQPMYIAATAFLMESANINASVPMSREATPTRNMTHGNHGSPQAHNGPRRTSGPSDNNQPGKHIYHAANQNYQVCYKALQQLQTYWAGTTYILTVLDQKAEGIWDPETYTSEEMESTKVPRPGIPQDWKRRLPTGLPTAPFSLGSPGMKSNLGLSPKTDGSRSPMLDSTHPIGWSLTGTTNSPSSNLAFLYQSMNGESASPAPSASLPGNMIYDPIRQSFPETCRATTAITPHPTYNILDHLHTRQEYTQQQNNMDHSHSHSHSHAQMPGPNAAKFPQIQGQTPAAPSINDAKMLLDLQHSPHPYTRGESATYQSGAGGSNHSTSHNGLPQQHDMANSSTARYDFALSDQPHNQDHNGVSFHGWAATGYLHNQGHPMGNGSGNGSWSTISGVSSLSGLHAMQGLATEMMIESQEIDMSVLGGDMMPYLEYLPWPGFSGV